LLAQSGLLLLGLSAQLIRFVGRHSRALGFGLGGALLLFGSQAGCVQLGSLLGGLLSQSFGFGLGCGASHLGFSTCTIGFGGC